MADLKSEKDVWLNKLRQTKEYQGSEEGRKYLNDLDPVKKVMAQQIDEELESQPWDTSKYGGGFKDVAFDDLETPEEIKEIKKEITLNEQMQEIAGIVAPTIHDVIFNEIIEVMDDYPDLNWGYFVQDDAPTALLDACFDHKTEIHYEIFQLVLQKLK